PLPSSSVKRRESLSSDKIGIRGFQGACDVCSPLGVSSSPRLSAVRFSLVQFGGSITLAVSVMRGLTRAIEEALGRAVLGSSRWHLSGAARTAPIILVCVGARTQKL